MRRRRSQRCLATAAQAVVDEAAAATMPLGRCPEAARLWETRPLVTPLPQWSPREARRGPSAACQLSPSRPTPPHPSPPQAYGISLGTMMCQRLLDGGAPGIHMYTLNLERSAGGWAPSPGCLQSRFAALVGAGRWFKGFPFSTRRLPQQRLRPLASAWGHRPQSPGHRPSALPAWPLHLPAGVRHMPASFLPPLPSIPQWLSWRMWASLPRRSPSSRRPTASGQPTAQAREGSSHVAVPAAARRHCLHAAGATPAHLHCVMLYALALPTCFLLRLSAVFIAASL